MKPQATGVYVACGECGWFQQDTWAKGTKMVKGKQACRKCDSTTDLKWIGGDYRNGYQKGYARKRYLERTANETN